MNTDITSNVDTDGNVRTSGPASFRISRLRRNRFIATAMLAAGALALTACGDDADATDDRIVDGVLSVELSDFSFGELPELLEIRKGSQTLFGYPALVDKGTHCDVEVFDDPQEAERIHHAGLRRLFALQPAPGPPCTNTAGLPRGLPHCS